MCVNMYDIYDDNLPVSAFRMTTVGKWGGYIYLVPDDHSVPILFSASPQWFHDMKQCWRICVQMTFHLGSPVILPAYQVCGLHSI